MSNLRPHILQKIEKALSEMSYRDAIENSSRYNNQLVGDRKTRLPFLDSQTGVAQRDCSLWMQKWQRMPGTAYGQLYTYPAHRWKKRRRGYLLNEEYFYRNRAIETIDKKGCEPHNNGSEIVQAKTEHSENSSDRFVENSKEAWSYGEYEDSIDLAEGEFEEPNSDVEDYDEFTVKRRRRRKETTRRRKGPIDTQGSDRPFQCDQCDARYKTRPGLTYHAKSHNSNDGDRPSKTPISNPDDDESNGRTTPRNNHSSTSSASDNQELSSLTDKGRNSADPSPYCDFCLGDSEENKKSRSREKMVSCSDCGRSAHPTCLQFTPQMILSVQKYRWQCIECKSCGLCGTSDNDEQLLFCDDCDRGYHMYCLKPPLSEPPEGSWSCHLCIEEYHKPKPKNESTDEDKKEKTEKNLTTDGGQEKNIQKEKELELNGKTDEEQKVKNGIKKEQDVSSLKTKDSNNLNELKKIEVKDELIATNKKDLKKDSPTEVKESKQKDHDKVVKNSAEEKEKAKD